MSKGSKKNRQARRHLQAVGSGAALTAGEETLVRQALDMLRLRDAYGARLIDVWQIGALLEAGVQSA